MDRIKLCAWRAHRQGLDGSLHDRPPAEVLSATGWQRSVGGSGPYIGIFSRSGAGRPAVDRAVAETSIHELPAARGCTYVLPQSDFALGLRAGQPFAGGDMAVARKLGVTGAEIDRLCRTVLDVLRAAPLDPEGIRTAAGAAARSLGEAGRKKGLTTTLPLALGRLQAEGEIRRIPTNGRLDQQRYRYAVWSPNPLASFKLTAEEASTELARRYFQWIAPATLAEFQWFSGLGVKAANAAIAPLGLEPLAAGDARLIPADLRRELAAFKPPAKPRYVLVGPIDGILLLRRELQSMLDVALPVADHGGKPGGGLLDLPSHGILDRGRVIGLWEYDPGTESIAWATSGRSDAALRDAVQRMEQFVRHDLGDARSFSLDSPRSRASRIAALRESGLLK